MKPPYLECNIHVHAYRQIRLHVQTSQSQRCFVEMSIKSSNLPSVYTYYVYHMYIVRYADRGAARIKWRRVSHRETQ